jgi:hypothetical protein
VSQGPRLEKVENLHCAATAQKILPASMTHSDHTRCYFGAPAFSIPNLTARHNQYSHKSASGSNATFGATPGRLAEYESFRRKIL